MYLCNISPSLLTGPAEYPAAELHVGETVTSLSASAGDGEVVGGGSNDASSSGIDVYNSIVAELLVVEAATLPSAGDKEVVGFGCWDVDFICISGIDVSNPVVGK